MRKAAAWILMIVMLLSTACAENSQKAPDYLMEGYDGNVSYRVWDTNLFFERMQESTGISFQLRQHTDYDEWTRRKEELLSGTDLPDVLFKAELSASEVRDLYGNGYIIDLAPYLEQYAPDLWKALEEHPEWEKAISMQDGIAHIDPNKCTSCGACVKACPRSVIRLLPVSQSVIVRCRNSDVARMARSVCMDACIGCGRCKKECQYDAIVVENGFARIIPEKCTRCGDCAAVCPCKCITVE